MRAVILLAAAVAGAFAQSRALLPDIEFDLNPTPKPQRLPRGIRTYLSAGVNGLTFVSIRDNKVVLSSADGEGHLLHLRSGLASVNGRIYAALPRPDGSVWLVSSAPETLSQRFAGATDFGNALPAAPVSGRNSLFHSNYNDLDLYSSAGEHLTSVRLLSYVAGAETPLAATNQGLVLLGAGPANLSSSQQPVLHFEESANGRSTEHTNVQLTAPVTGALPLMTPDGTLLLIDRKSGNMVVVNPRIRNGGTVLSDAPGPVQAATADSDSVYLLSSGIVIQRDLSGREQASYRLQFDSGFEPASLAVSGSFVYVADRAGRTERFRLR